MTDGIRTPARAGRRPPLAASMSASVVAQGFSTFPQAHEFDDSGPQIATDVRCGQAPQWSAAWSGLAPSAPVLPSRWSSLAAVSGLLPGEQRLLARETWTGTEASRSSMPKFDAASSAEWLLCSR